MEPAVYPVALHNHREGRWLEVTWSDGMVGMLPHRLLREACRCAQCVAVARAGGTVAPGHAVRLEHVEAFGANCVRLMFSDGHDRGLYPFEYLRELPAAAAVRHRVQQENELAKPSSNSGLR